MSGAFWAYSREVGSGGHPDRKGPQLLELALGILQKGKYMGFRVLGFGFNTKRQVHGVWGLGFTV